MAYFIKIGAEKWAELDAFNFFAESPVQFGTIVPQPGPANFSSVNVQLSSDALLPNIIASALLPGTQDVIIRSTTSTGAGQQVLYDMVLSGAVITQMDETLSNGPALALSYGEIGITTYAGNSKAFTTAGSFDWDLTTNDPTPENLPVPPPVKDLDKAAPDLMPSRYVMAIDGLAGGSDLAGHKGWFDITNFDYGFSRSHDISNDAVSPVNTATFTVSVADQGALASLLDLAAKGSLINAVEIDGLNLSNALLAQTRFGDVHVKLISDNGANGYDVVFVATKLNSDVFDPASSSSTAHVEFDFGTQTPASVIAAPVVATAIEAAAPLRYFLALSGFVGGAVEAGHERWFALDDIRFDLDASGGLPVFSNLGLDVSNDTGIADFMARMVGGKDLSLATVHGVDSKGNVVYTLDMGNVGIESVTDSSSGGFGLDLSFHKVELSTKGYNIADALKPAQSFGWDLDAGVALAGLNSANPGGKTPAIPVTPQTFFMLVEGMNGGSTDPGHQRWFELTNFDFSGFMASGTPDFSMVETSIKGDAGRVAMFKAAVLGSELKGIRIEGVADNGGLQSKVYELALSDVRVASVDDRAGAGYDADFDYGKFSLRTYDAVTGAVTGVSGWDRVNDVATTLRPGLSASKVQTEAVADSYYFGVKTEAGNIFVGDSQIKGFEGLSSVVDYEFNVVQPTFEGANTGATELGRLSLTFDSDTALPSFLNAIATGLLLESATLAGLFTFDKSTRLASTLNLGRGLVTALNDLAGGGFTVEIDFEKFSLNQVIVNPTTLKSTGSEVFGWDDAQDKTATVASILTGSKELPVGASTYVMAIDGFHGDLTSTARGGWLDIQDLTFTGVNSGHVGDAGPGGSGGGKFDLDRITVQFASDSGLTTLLDYMTKGTPIAGIQIEGNALNVGGVEKTVQTYQLQDVYVMDVTDTAGAGYSVSLKASRFELRQFSLLGATAGETAWNFQSNNSAGPTITVNPGGTSGNDVISGNRENNILSGLLGADSLYGNDGADQLSGNEGKDRLVGGTGRDTLNGGEGDDVLTGGLDRDVLSGGVGFDVYKFNQAAESAPGVNRDVITDFIFNDDVIDFSALSAGELFFLTAGLSFFGIDQVRVIASATNPASDSIVQVNLAGDTTPELEIYVQNQNYLGFLREDFIL